MTTSPNQTSEPATQRLPQAPAGPPTRARGYGWWMFAIAIIAAGIIGYVMYTKSAAPSPPAAPASSRAGGQGGAGNRPLPVIAQAAKTGDMAVYLSALGAVVAQGSVTVHPRVDGQLMRIAFREGQVVRAGDLLAEIDPRPFQVQLAQAEGQMAKDQALLNNARKDVERYAMLFSQDSIAKQQLDTQISLVAQYEGAIKADQAQIDTAKLQLTYARVTAPIGGRLGLRQVDAGNIVHAADANGIVVITQVRPISVVFTLPEDSIARVVKRLREGAKLVVEAYDREQRVKLATGVLLTIDNQIDSATGTFKLKAQFANDDESLFPNQFVNARMLVDTQHDATLVPTAAVQRGAQGTFVYVVKEDLTVTVRPVTLGPALGETSSITQGLQAGERVVVDGADKLREGGKVELITRDAQNASGPGARRGPPRDGQPRGDKGARTAGVPPK